MLRERTTGLAEQCAQIRKVSTLATFGKVGFGAQHSKLFGHGVSYPLIEAEAFCLRQLGGSRHDRLEKAQ